MKTMKKTGKTMNNTTRLFELKNVNYSYSGNPALKGVNFSVKQGEQIAILGANGCGKSTLLKIMNGLVFPTSGKIVAFGTELSESLLDDNEAEFTQSFRKNVGFVFQNSEVQLFCPTVLDEVKFGPLQLDMPHNELNERADDVIKMLNISHIKNRLPHTLSGGEKKRVAIAATLVSNPNVMLLDEPTSSLDPRTEHMLIHLLLELRDNKTMIIATHKLEIAKEICTRAIVIDENHRIVADGAIDDVLSDTKLLLKANLIHENHHSHGSRAHRHIHI